MDLAFHHDGTKVPRELFGLFVRETLSDDGLAQFAQWLERLGDSGASSLNWETRRFLCSVIERNREELGCRFLSVVRALPDSVPEKLRLLVAIGGEEDVAPLISRLEANPGSDDFFEISAAVMALLVISESPGGLVERFSRIVLTRLRAEEYFQEANYVWETIQSAYGSGAVTPDTIVEVVRSEGVSREVRYGALSLIGENRREKFASFEEMLVTAGFEIITSTIAEPVLSPRHRDPQCAEYTRNLRNKAAEVILDIFESSAEPSVRLKALETLVALSRIGCLPAQYAHRFADVCVNRRGIDPTIHQKWFLRAVSCLGSRW